MKCNNSKYNNFNLFLFKWEWASKHSPTIRYKHGQNIWEKLSFSCEIVHHGKSSISIFKKSLKYFGEQFSGHEQIIISRNFESLIFLSYSKRFHHQDYIYFYKNVPEIKSILQLRIRLKGTLMQIWKSPHILKFI